MLVKQKIAQLGNDNTEYRVFQHMNVEIRVEMGRRLGEERDRLGLTQPEFALLGDVKPRTLQDWERGIAAPNSEFLARVNAHGVDVLYVVTGQHTAAASSQLTDAESALLTRFRSGSPTLRGYLQEIGTAPAAGNTVSIGGDVGQSIAGDASFSAPVTFGSAKARK